MSLIADKLFVEKLLAKKNKRGKRVVKLYEDTINYINQLERIVIERKILLVLLLMSLCTSAILIVSYIAKFKS